MNVKFGMLFQTPRQRSRVLCLLGCSTLFPLLVFSLMICGERCRFDDDPKRFSDIQLFSVSAIAFVYCVLSILLTRELFAMER